ncbi:hypothetical protein MKX01_012469 [Papaver californicum]|nr:hypothetical protein MKX01_012469 [Papaver californicum]
MRKRKERTRKDQQILICNTEERYEEKEHVEEEEGKGFHACYLLCSMCPRFNSHTYIGYTVDPCRRIRQHNGETTNGAVRTKRKRPWEMMLCIYRFPTDVSALQFEWAWQHPIESLAVRQAALSFKSLSGIANHVKLAYKMLSLPPWQNLKLTVNFFSTAYTKHASGCPSLPKQMKVQVCSMGQLPCNIDDSQISDEIEDEEEWEHEDAENGIGEISQSERSKDVSDENSVAYLNTDHDWETLIEDYGSQQQRDSHSLRGEDNEKPSTEDGDVENPDTYHDWERLIEDDGLQQQRGSCRLIEEEDNERPSRDIDSSPETLSTKIARLVNRRQLVVESDPFGLFAETGNKMGPPTKQILTTIADAKAAFRRPKESLTSREGAKLPSFVADSPLQTPSSSISRFVDTQQAIEDRDSFELIEETGSEASQDPQGPKAPLPD